MGNLLSVRRALEHVGAEVELCSDPEKLVMASKIILPGVGAFADAMTELRRLGLDMALRSASNQGIPILGICLGMQLLFESSEEFGHTSGLGLIPGHVVGIPRLSEKGVERKIPHIGWNELVLSGGRQSWRGTVLETVDEGFSVYFVHSFMAVPDHPADCLANCLYEGQVVTAAVEHGNVLGCQFHPEKSGQIGLTVIRKFISL